jgi:hypothetical protein
MPHFLTTVNPCDKASDHVLNGLEVAPPEKKFFECV